MKIKVTNPLLFFFPPVHASQRRALRKQVPLATETPNELSEFCKKIYIVPVNCERVKKKKKDRKNGQQLIVMLELSQQFVSSVFALWCVWCVLMQPRPTHCLGFLLRSMALTPTHISASFFFSEPEAKWHGKERETGGLRAKYFISIEPWFLSRFHEIILRNLARSCCA